MNFHSTKTPGPKPDKNLLENIVKFFEVFDPLSPRFTRKSKNVTEIFSFGTTIFILKCFQVSSMTSPKHYLHFPSKNHAVSQVYSYFQNLTPRNTPDTLSQTECERHNAYLPYPTSAEQNNDLTMYMRSENIANAWLGISDAG